MTSLIPWRNPLPRTKANAREAILEITIDDRGFAEGMRRMADAIKEANARRRLRYQIELERARGRQYVTDLIVAWRAELGLPDTDRPTGDAGPPNPTRCGCSPYPECDQ